MSYHIWTLQNWENNKTIAHSSLRSGLRLRFDQEVDPAVRASCKRFAAFLRNKYYFPIRVVVYVKQKEKIRAMDGDLCYGTFWRVDDYSEEPYIRIAAGDYPILKAKWGEDNALASILQTIAHELTHYFQWINALPLTQLGEERQATRYSKYLLEEYAEHCDHP